MVVLTQAFCLISICNWKAVHVDLLKTPRFFVLAYHEEWKFNTPSYIGTCT